jgi:VanZ family protein
MGLGWQEMVIVTSFILIPVLIVRHYLLRSDRRTWNQILIIVLIVTLAGLLSAVYQIFFPE